VPDFLSPPMPCLIDPYRVHSWCVLPTLVAPQVVLWNYLWLYRWCSTLQEMYPSTAREA